MATVAALAHCSIVKLSLRLSRYVGPSVVIIFVIRGLETMLVYMERVIITIFVVAVSKVVL